MAIHDESAYEFSLNSGKDSDKPTDPHAGDIYISTDTGVLNICFDGSAWIEQPLPLKLPSYAESPTSEPLALPATATLTITEDICYLHTVAPYNGGILVSTAPTVAEIKEENILTAGSRNTASSTPFFLKQFENGLIKADSILYLYRYSINLTTMDALLANLDQCTRNATARSSWFTTKKAFLLKTPSAVIE